MLSTDYHSCIQICVYRSFTNKATEVKPGNSVSFWHVPLVLYDVDLFRYSLRFVVLGLYSSLTSLQVMVVIIKVPTSVISVRGKFEAVNDRRRWVRVISSRKRLSAIMAVAMSNTSMQCLEKSLELMQNTILVNGCTGKMGKAVVETAVSAGLSLVPLSFSSSEVFGKTVQVGGKEIQVYGPSERESILASTFEEYPNLVVVNYTVPAVVNGNYL